MACVGLHAFAFSNHYSCVMFMFNVNCVPEQCAILSSNAFDFQQFTSTRFYKKKVRLCVWCVDMMCNECAINSAVVLVTMKL